MDRPVVGGPPTINRWSLSYVVLLIGCVLVSFIPGAIGSLFSTDTPWYNSLTLPAWQPPGWVFGVVWPILYLLIGIALFVILRNVQSSRRQPILLAFAVQWVLNAVWSAIFFGMSMPVVALFVIVTMVVLVGFMVFKARFEAPVASALLVPYLLWLIYATSLNLGVIVLNT